MDVEETWRITAPRGKGKVVPRCLLRVGYPLEVHVVLFGNLGCTSDDHRDGTNSGSESVQMAKVILTIISMVRSAGVIEKTTSNPPFTFVGIEVVT